jgi:outer membrane protein OmpA-like peptidoglycan-associated protein
LILSITVKGIEEKILMTSIRKSAMLCLAAATLCAAPLFGQNLPDLSTYKAQIETLRQGVDELKQEAQALGNEITTKQQELASLQKQIADARAETRGTPSETGSRPETAAVPAPAASSRQASSREASSQVAAAPSANSGRTTIPSASAPTASATSSQTSAAKTAPAPTGKTAPGALWKAIYFGPNSTIVGIYFQDDLNKVGRALEANPNLKVTVCGYALPTGRREGWLAIARLRALNVAKYLNANFKIADGQMDVTWADEHKVPLTSGTDTTHRVVEITYR